MWNLRVLKFFYISLLKNNIEKPVKKTAKWAKFNQKSDKKDPGKIFNVEITIEISVCILQSIGLSVHIKAKILT